MCSYMPHNPDFRRVHRHYVIVLDSYQIKMHPLNIIQVCSTYISCLNENGKFTWNDQWALNITLFPIQVLLKASDKTL